MKQWCNEIASKEIELFLEFAITRNTQSSGGKERVFHDNCQKFYRRTKKRPIYELKNLSQCSFNPSMSSAVFLSASKS